MRQILYQLLKLFLHLLDTLYLIMISGVYSKHDNGAEDRKFYLTICTLTPRCTELESIVYDYDKMQSSMETVVAGQAIKDNLNHPEAGIIKATMEKSKQESLSDSYSFEKEESSSHEIGFR